MGHGYLKTCRPAGLVDGLKIMIGVNLLDCIRQKGVTLIEKLKIHRVLPGNSIDGEHSV